MSDLTLISQWLTQQPEQIISFENDKQRSTKDFLKRVLQWKKRLEHQSGNRWAVYHDDAFEFLSMTFALWQLGRTACVPGDNRPGTIERLTTHVAGFIGKFPSPAITLEQNDNHPSELVEWINLESSFHALEIYTSGSTGEPKPISKTIRQIEEELETLEILWPSKASSVVITTVSHQHLYGITFRLLWPLSAGRAFQEKLCEYPEDILQQAKYHSSFSLVSSPSHLARLNASLDWDAIAKNCDYVVSSAAPLKRQDSLAAAKLLQAPVREIYGSSETGAIAWRIQQEHNVETLWQALPKVELSETEEGALKVETPYLESNEPYILADQVVFGAEKKFKLMGRKDRIVKVEGKRVSLAAIEIKLSEASAAIKEVRVITLERQRIETAVIIELTEVGRQELEQSGRKTLIAKLKVELAKHFEAVVLPRRWRFVDAMPFNPQGKLPLESLMNLFKKEAVIWPQVKKKKVEEESLSMECFIPAELLYFDGHFEDRAILPGIVQVHWAEAYGRQFLDVTGHFIRLEVIKFQQIIPPNSIVTINLEYVPATMKLVFEYVSEKGVHSNGRICFG